MVRGENLGKLLAFRGERIRQLVGRVDELTGETDKLRALLAESQSTCGELSERLAAVDKLYHQLIMEVGQKFMGESRHETALRYIKEAEAPPFETASTERQPL